MKITTEIIALCDYASISQDNKLSINGIFDQVGVTQFPGGLARCFLVATLKSDPNKQYQMTIKLESNDHNVKIDLKPMNLEANVGANGKHNLIIEFVNIPFGQPGEYRFVIYNKDEEIRSAILNVFHIKQNINRQNIQN